MTEQVAMLHDTPVPVARPAQRRAPRIARPSPGRLAMLRPWVFPAVLLVLFEVYARRAVAPGSEALAPPSAALKALAGAALDGS